MFGLVIVKRKNDKENTCQQSSQIKSEEKQEKIVVDIDYNALAKAIVDANQQLLQEKDLAKKQEEDTYRQKRKMLLGNSENALEKLWNFLKLNNSEAKEFKGMYLFFPFLNALLLGLSELVFIVSSCFLGLNGLFSLCKTILLFFDNSTVGDFFVMLGVTGFYIIASALLFVFFKLFRVARLEIEDNQDERLQFALFGHLCSFNALLFTIITLILKG